MINKRQSNEVGLSYCGVLLLNLISNYSHLIWVRNGFSLSYQALIFFFSFISGLKSFLFMSLYQTIVLIIQFFFFKSLCELRSFFINNIFWFPQLLYKTRGFFTLINLLSSFPHYFAIGLRGFLPSNKYLYSYTFDKANAKREDDCNTVITGPIIKWFTYAKPHLYINWTY